MPPLSASPPTPTPTMMTSTAAVLPAPPSDSPLLPRGRGRRSLSTAFPWLQDEISNVEQEDERASGAAAPRQRKGRASGLQTARASLLPRDEKFSALRDELASSDGRDEEEGGEEERTRERDCRASRQTRRRTLSLTQQGKQLLQNEKFSALRDELVPDGNDGDDGPSSGNNNNGQSQKEAEMQAAPSRLRPKRLSDLIRQQSINMLQNVLEEDKAEGDDGDEERERRLRRVQSFRRTAYLLHRVGDSLASEACSGVSSEMMNSATTGLSFGTEDTKESFASDITRKVKNAGAGGKGSDPGWNVVLSRVFGASFSALSADDIQCDNGKGAEGSRASRGLSSLGSESLGVGGERARRRGSRLASEFLSDVEEIIDAGASDANGNLDAARVNALIERVLNDRRRHLTKAKRGRRDSVDCCPTFYNAAKAAAATSGDGGGGATADTSNKTLDPEAFLWDSHDFAHRLGSDRSLPYRGAATVSDSVRALNLDEGGGSGSGGSIVPDQVLNRKMSSGRLYLKILEDWNERRDRRLLGEREEAGPRVAGGKSESSDCTIKSATDCLWSDGSLKPVLSGELQQLHGSKQGSSCYGGGKSGSAYFGRDHASQSIRALDLDMEGTAERVIRAASLRRKVMAQIA